MKSLQNAEGDKMVEVVVVATITVTVADTDADITDATAIATATAIVVRLITRILRDVSRTPVPGHTGDAIMHRLSARVKLLRTKMTWSGIITWEDLMLFVSQMWNDGGRWKTR